VRIIKKNASAFFSLLLQIVLFMFVIDVASTKVSNAITYLHNTSITARGGLVFNPSPFNIFSPYECITN